MTPYDDEPRYGEEPALLDSRPLRGRAGLAWAVILVVTVAVAVLQQVRPAPQQKRNEGKGGELEMGNFLARYLVGIGEMVPQARGELAHKLDEQPVETFRDRLRLVITAGELGGAKEALESLEKLEANPNPAPLNEDRHLMEILGRLYRGYLQKPDPGILKPAEQEMLRKQLGWAGELALVPMGGPDASARQGVISSATSLVGAIIAGALGGCIGLVTGVVVLILILIALFGRKPNRGLATGSPYGGVYAEMFAVWIVAFVLLQVASAFIPVGDSKLFVSAVLSLLSLAALAWPVMRGVPWVDVREELGLTFLGQPLRQVLSGPVCYLASLPLLLIGGIVFFALFCIWTLAPGQKPPGMEHPVAEDLVNPSNWTLFQVYFAACFAAPVVEEIFFRGALYRHLREATSRWTLFGSFLASGLLTSLIFAIVHPQGLLAVPLLMSVAMGFTLGREWRGSIVPCIIAHGIHNGLAITLVLKMLGN